MKHPVLVGGVAAVLAYGLYKAWASSTKIVGEIGPGGGDTTVTPGGGGVAPGKEPDPIPSTEVPTVTLGGVDVVLMGDTIARDLFELLQRELFVQNEHVESVLITIPGRAESTIYEWARMEVSPGARRPPKWIIVSAGTVDAMMTPPPPSDGTIGWMTKLRQIATEGVIWITPPMFEGPFRAPSEAYVKNEILIAASGRATLVHPTGISMDANNIHPSFSGYVELAKIIAPMLKPGGQA